MQKEVKIRVPEGMEIDQENSTFECIKFKPKTDITYEEIQKMFLNPFLFSYCANVDCAMEHYNKLIVYRKLLEVADYLNDDWKPDWENDSELKYNIFYDHYLKRIHINAWNRPTHSPVFFKSEELAKQAIQIIGEDNLKIFFE